MPSQFLPRRLREAVRKARKAALLLREPAWRRGLRAGVAASIEHEQLPLPSTLGTVIDVGANRGQFALFARARFPNARVFSLEPLSAPRRRLEALFRDDAAVSVLPFAAGSASGKARIHVSRSDDSSSLLAETEMQTQRFPGTEIVGQEEVEVQTLDQLFADADLAAPLLLKLDVQGFELEALRGAGSLLQRTDWLLTECSFVRFYEGQPLFEEILTFLAPLGFRLVGGAISSQHEGRWEQGDFLFQRQVSADATSITARSFAA